MYGIESVPPTVCYLFKVPPPAIVSSRPLAEVLRAAERRLKGKPVEKLLVYATDAVGEWLYQAYKNEYRHVLDAAPIQVEMRTVNPSYTPVC